MSLRIAVALTILSGVLYGLAFPPAWWWPGAWIALAPFFVAVRSGNAWRAIGLGLLLGVVASAGVAGWLPRAVAQHYRQSILIGAVVFLACAALQSCWQLAGFALLY